MRKLKYSRRCVLYVAELIIFLALILYGLLIGTEGILKLQADQLNGNAEGIWVSEELQLKSGIYEVVLEADIPPESSVTLLWEYSDANIFRSILSNPMTMEAGQNSFRGKVTVTANVQNVYLKIIGSGNMPQNILKSLYIEKNGQLYLVYGVCFLIGITILNLLLGLRRAIVEGSISGEQQTAVWILGAAVLTAGFPGLADYITTNGDTMKYLMLAERFSVMPATGIFGEDVLALLKGNVFLFIPAILRIIGFTVQTSWQFFVWGIHICTAIVAYRCFAGTLRNLPAALMVSTLYLLNPYRTYCFYRLGNVGLWLGISFLPLLICGVLELFKKSRKQFLNIMVGLMGFAYCGWSGLHFGQMLLSLGSATCILCTGQLVLKIKNAFYQKLIMIFIAAVVFGVALYQINDLAFYMAPAYLYDLNEWIAETGEQLSKEWSLLWKV